MSNPNPDAIAIDTDALAPDQARAVAVEFGRAFAAVGTATSDVGRLLASTELTDAHAVTLHAYADAWRDLDREAADAIGALDTDPRAAARAIDARHADGRRLIDQFADAFAALGMTADHLTLLEGYARTVAAIEDHRSDAVRELLGLSGRNPAALN